MFSMNQLRSHQIIPQIPMEDIPCCKYKNMIRFSSNLTHLNQRKASLVQSIVPEIWSSSTRVK